MYHNHSGLGVVTEYGFEFPDALLDPLQLKNEQRITCLYYPPPEKIGDYSNINFRNDFMLTPIESKLWPRVSRLVIRVKHQKGMMAEVAKCIYKADASIQSAVFSRSSHRYATWSLVISFDNLRESDLEFDPNYGYFTRTKRESDRIQKSILNECKNVLFVADNHSELSSPVSCHPIEALAYFGNYIKKSQGIEGKPFLLQRKDHQILPERTEILRSILYRTDEPRDPFLGFAEMDAHDINMRFVQIGRQHQASFAEVTIKYLKRNNTSSSRGLMEHILTQLKDRYNVWSSSQATLSTTSPEVGSITLILEEQGAQAGRFSEERFCERRSHDLYKIFKDHKPDYLKGVSFSERPLVKPINVSSVRKRIFKIETNHDVFLIHHHDDFVSIPLFMEFKNALDEAGVNYYLAEKDGEPGKPLPEELIKAMRGSSIVVALLSEKSLKRNWVKAEMHGACFLGKPIFCIRFKFSKDALVENIPEMEGVLSLLIEKTSDIPDLIRRIRKRVDQDIYEMRKKPF